MSTSLVRFPARGVAVAPSEPRRLLASDAQSAPALEQRAIGDNYGWQIVRGEQPTQFQGSGREVRVLGFERNPIVQACARAIVDLIKAVDFEAYRKAASGDVTVLAEHESIDLLHRPRVGTNRVQFRALVGLHFSVYGNAFVVIERKTPRGKPSGLRVVHPEMVLYCYLDPDTHEILSYDWRDRVGEVHHTPATDMLHFKDLSGGDWLFGYPRAASALLDISADAEASQYVRQVVKNDGSPTLMVLLEGAGLSPPQLEAAEERWQEKMVKRGGRGRARFVGGVKEVVQLGFNLHDLEFPALRAISREDICAAFGVDPRMVGVASARGQEGGLSGVQYREARFRLLQHTVIPVMVDIEAALDDWFMPEYGDLFVRFSPDSLSRLTEDEEATSVRVTRELAAGARTREESRKAIGLPDKMDPKDTLVGSLSRMEYPVALQFAHTQADETNPDQAPQVADGGTPPKQLPAGGAGAGDVVAADPKDGKAASDTKRALGSLMPTPRSRVLRRGIALTSEQRLELWKHFDTRATKQEGAYRRAAAVLFQTEKQGVQGAFASAAARSLSAGGVERRAADDAEIGDAMRRITSEYAPGGGYHQAWLDRYRALITQTFSTAGDAIAGDLGLDFTLDNPRVIAAINARANKLAGQVSETTYDQIRAAVAVGREGGMGIREIADLIDESVFGNTCQARATTIARTESIGAMNQGEYLTAKESRVLRSKEWLTQGDDKVRDSHAALDGQRVDIDETFDNGLQYPGDQSGDADQIVNCRCTCLFYDEEAPA